MCFKKPRKPLKNKKAIHKVGKQAAKWMETRGEWLQKNPPTHEGYWYCHYCGTSLTIDTLTVDHVIPRSRAPHLRHEQSNLVACCGKCNSLKGSRVLD